MMLQEKTYKNIIQLGPKFSHDHPYRILIIGGSGSGKTNSLFHFINYPPVIGKIYLYVKDSYEVEY